MNGMGGAPMNAMLSGTAAGQQAAARILPNTYQTQGKSAPQNPWQGSFDIIVDQLLSLGKQIKDQGEEFRKQGEECFGFAHDLAKLNREITKIAQEGPSSNNVE